MEQSLPFGYYCVDMPEDYFSALGKLHHAFTSLEVSLTNDAAHLVIAKPLQAWDTHTVIAIHAVLGGMRMNDAVTLLKRLYKALNVRKEIIEQADLIFKQIGDIQYFRNRLTHYPTNPQNDGIRLTFINSDEDASKDISKTKVIEFDLDIMTAATRDLLEAIGLMGDISETIHGPHDYRPFSPPTWQYKSSQLVERDQRLTRNPLPPLPPHKSQRE